MNERRQHSTVTPEELSEAILKALGKVGMPVLLAALFAVVGTIVGAKLWASGVDSRAERAVAIADSALAKAARNAGAIQSIQQVQTDLVLLQCAQPGLNRTEQQICAKYEPRMPR